MRFDTSCAVDRLVEEFHISHKDYDLVKFLCDNLPEDKVSILLFEHRITGKPIYDAILNVKYFEESFFLNWLAQEKRVKYFDLVQEKYTINKKVVHEIGLVTLIGQVLLPIRVGYQDYLVMDDFRKADYEKINILFDSLFTPAIASRAQILEILNRAENRGSIKEFARRLLEVEVEEYPDCAKNFWDIIIDEAIDRNASDIHMIPTQCYVVIKLRIDGSLSEECIIHIKYWEALVVRLKVLSKMDITEKRAPQDGSLTVRYCGRDVDLRCAIHPTIWGENVVVRILKPDTSYNSFHNSGYTDEQLELLKYVSQKKSGITIISGPTGSGKTTSVYNLLRLFDPNLNIMTIEDPVEYKLRNISQTDISKCNNLTYADGIKSLLRQDPDIIFVGEIRDIHSARMLARAAMTGHHIISTMHTDNTLEVLGRFDEFGVSLKWVTSNLNLIVSQKLVRVLCNKCKQPYEINHAESLLLNLPMRTILYTPRGCSECHSGFTGRTVVAEMLKIDSDFIDFVSNNINNIYKYFKMNKIITLKEVIINEMRRGRISVHDGKSIIR